jgi:hypothetical protein
MGTLFEIRALGEHLELIEVTQRAYDVDFRYIYS